MWPHCSVSCCCCCFGCINHWQPVDGGATGQCGRHEISLTARHIAIPSHWLKFVGWLRQRLQLLLQFRRQMTKLSPLRTLNRRTMGKETETEAARELATAMWLRMEGKWRKQDMARLAAQLINFRISDSSLSGINDALASEWFINSCKRILIPLPRVPRWNRLITYLHTYLLSGQGTKSRRVDWGNLVNCHQDAIDDLLSCRAQDDKYIWCICAYRMMDIYAIYVHEQMMCSL